MFKLRGTPLGKIPQPIVVQNFRDMATGEEKALAVAKARFNQKVTKLKGLVEEKETELIPAAVEQVEKTWSEFNDLLSEKIAAGNEELEGDAVKFVREKDKITSEARKMIKPNLTTEATGKKKLTSGGIRRQAG